MIRARIVVEGEVQRVGYRDLVQSVARKLGVMGFVENLRNGTVQIVCEAEEKALDEFVKAINVMEEFIAVERIRVVETSEATGEFEYFDIRYGPVEEELGDRMVMAVNYAKATRTEIREMRSEMRSELKGVHSEIREMRLDVNRGFQEMRSDIQEMHSDMNRSFLEMAKRYDAISAELVRTREELTRAVDGLLKLIEEFIHKRREERSVKGRMYKS